MESSDRGNVQDTAVLPLDHAGDEQAGEFGERRDIQVCQLQVSLGGNVGEGPHFQHPGIIDQGFYMHAFGDHCLEELSARIGFGEIRRQRDSGNAVFVH